jgi:hypothetical protein
MTQGIPRGNSPVSFFLKNPQEAAQLLLSGLASVR